MKNHLKKCPYSRIKPTHLARWHGFERSQRQKHIFKREATRIMNLTRLPIEKEKKKKNVHPSLFCSKEKKKTTTTSTRRCITHTVGMYRRPNLVWLDYGYTTMAPQLMGDCNQLCSVSHQYIYECVLITNTSPFRLAKE